MTSAFLFDIGNVILPFDFSIAAHRISPHCDLEPEAAFREVSQLTDSLELGHLDAPGFIAEASKRIGYWGTPEFFHDSFADIFNPNDRIISLIERIHAAGVPLHLLSNTNPIHVSFFESAYPVFGLFEGRIYSHEVGAMKPDPKIYEITLSRLELDPATTIYIDDLAANCEAGREAGLISLQYLPDDPDSFYEELERHLPPSVQGT